MVRTKLGIVLPILLAVTALLAQGRGLAGQWENSRVDDQGKTHVTSYTFDVQGDTFTGSVMRTIGEKSKITNGKIKGNAISFTEVWAGHERTVDSTGVIAGDKLTLTKPSGDGATREIVAMRKKPGK